MTIKKDTLLSLIFKVLLYAGIAAIGYCIYTAYVYGKVLTFAPNLLSRCNAIDKRFGIGRAFFNYFC